MQAAGTPPQRRAPPSVSLDRPDGDAWQALNPMLANRELRTALFGGHSDVSYHAACAIWQAPVGRSERRCAIRCGASGRVVGGLGVVGGEVSFFVAPASQGLGYARSAMAALLRWRMEQGLQSPWTAQTLIDNGAARRVLTASGFRESGVVGQGPGLPGLVAYLLDPAMAPLVVQGDPSASDVDRSA